MTAKLFLSIDDRGRLPVGGGGPVWFLTVTTAPTRSRLGGSNLIRELGGIGLTVFQVHP